MGIVRQRSLGGKADDSALTDSSIRRRRHILKVESESNYKRMPLHLPLLFQSVVGDLLFPEDTLRGIQWEVTGHSGTHFTDDRGYVSCIVCLEGNAILLDQ